PLTVEPRTRWVIHEGDVVQAPQVAALVDFNGGGGVVEQVTNGAYGSSITPCASTASDRWYFPAGSTDRDWTLTLQLFNPFPGDHDAQVEVDVGLDQGEAEPFTLSVPAHSSYILHASAESRIPKGVAHAATIRSLNGVPVVAARTVVAAAPAVHTGMATLLGARRATTRWALAAGTANAATDEWVIVQNPGPAPVTVSITALAAGQLLPIEG